MEAFRLENGEPQSTRASFALRICLSGLALSAIFLFALGSTTYSVLRNEIRTGLVQMLDREAWAAADEVGEAISNVKGTADHIARSPIVANALTDTIRHDRYIAEFFGGFAKIGAVPATIGLADYTGTITVSGGDPAAFDALKVRIAGAIEAATPVALIARINEDPALVVIDPVFIARTGTVEGAIVASVPFSHLLPLNWATRSSLFTAQVVQIGSQQDWEPLGPSFGAPTAGPQRSGARWVSALRPLALEEPLAPLKLALFISAEGRLLYAPLDRLTVLFVVMGTTITLVVVGLCFWGGRRLCAPLRELEDVAQAVVDTQCFGQRVKVCGRDEVARLGTTFNRMLARLEDDAARRAETEKGLRESEARFRALIDNAPAGVSLQDLNGRYLVVNEEYARSASTTPQGAIGKTVDELFSSEATARAEKFTQLVLDTGQRQTYETSIVRPNGEVRDLLVTRFPILDERASLIGIGAILTDISEYKALQLQLAQAQKTETIGQLTGGIAHDFNNLLTVILGNSEELVEKLRPTTPLGRLASINTVAAQRAADLTQQLLSYARQQQLEPKTIDVNALVGSLGTLLERTLEESVTIEMELAPKLWPVKADPTRLETALMNLAINARDAMSNRGRLLITSANAWLGEADTKCRDGLRDGDYVKITVEDTGCGMPDEIVRKVFDPFFTTKEVGKGTGLGLSMVYGFVKQSGGHVDIYSKPSVGTTVTVYLPRSSTEDVEDDQGNEGDTAIEVGTGETILVVEDNDLVREHITDLLERLGYLVITTSDGRAALEVVGSEALIDLVFTDLVMPGDLDGVELAEAIQERRPGLKVLFTSGYAQGHLKPSGTGATGANFLQKPYTTSVLARTIRGALPHRRSPLIEDQLTPKP